MSEQYYLCRKEIYSAADSLYVSLFVMVVENSSIADWLKTLCTYCRQVHIDSMHYIEGLIKTNLLQSWDGLEETTETNNPRKLGLASQDSFI